jgi:hypothetical protein
MKPSHRFRATLASPSHISTLLVGIFTLLASQPASAIFLSEDLDVSVFDGRILTCSHPEVANNDTCTCAAGFSWKNGLCTSCQSGTYKPDDGLHECTSCPVHHLTFENATELEDCFCTYGYEPSGVDMTCRACQPGFFKDYIGNNACLPCTVNASTLTQTGGDITGSNSQTDCKCVSGFQGTFDTGCTACPVDYFKASDTPDHGCTACTQLRANLGTIGDASGDASDCVCKPGFFLDSDVCMHCASGTYKPEIANLLECSACPANSASAIASTNVDDCICDVGFFRDLGVGSFSCALCPADFFCPGQGLKQKCTEHSHSAAGSTSQDQCMCISSKYKLVDTCFDCPPDFFCPGDNTKQACPENSEARANSTSLSECVCDGGFQKQNDT